jgi:two-component system CheB/CheR fusion protein
MVAPTPRSFSAAAVRRVLVVDDHADSRDTMAVLLRASGHDVLGVSDGDAALAAVASFDPDVILLDIGLPGMDGFEVARRLRDDRPAHPVLLVAISGYGRPEHRRRAREAGFDRFFVKPVDIGALREVVGGT